MVKILLGSLILLFCMCFSGLAQEDVHLGRIDDYLNKIKESVDQQDEAAVDFWMARFIGEIVVNNNVEKTFDDLSPYLNRHRASRSTQQLKENYAESFLDWFIVSSQSQFGLDDIRVYENSFELANGNGATPAGNYFAAILAVPYIEEWEIGNRPSPQLIPLGSDILKPNIISGEMLVNTGKTTYYHKVPFEISGPLQHVWKPEFEDLDDDNIPELFIRYNYVKDNEVHQELAIFRFENNEPKLFKRFTGHYGGIARRIGNKQVEVGDSMPFGDQMNFETWEYRGSEFASISTQSKEHVLKSESWKDYY